jgi:hypothetical protein
MELTIDWIKKNNIKIHYFGLGFIQVKLNDFERLHFYTNKLSKTVEDEEIHNHRYNFVSLILKGKFTQSIFEVKSDINGDYLLTKESCDENNKMDFPKEPVSIIKVYEQYYLESHSYHINHNTFHTVHAEDNTITFLKRSTYMKEYADVIFHKNKSLTCPFSNKVSENDLYDIIKSML